MRGVLQELWATPLLYAQGLCLEWFIDILREAVTIKINI